MRNTIFGLCLAGLVVLAGGCGDLAMSLNVSARIENSEGNAIQGEKLKLIANSETVEIAKNRNTKIFPDQLEGEIVSDANGRCEFSVGLFRPGYGISDLFSKSLWFVIVFPDMGVDGYLVRFREGTNDVTYWRIDKKTGVILPDAYNDASGGLTARVKGRNDIWSRLPKLEVVVKIP
jgi:hypothetical protein